MDPIRTVLLVDDSEPIRKMMARALEAEGFAVVDVGSGPEALTVLDQGPLAIDMLVTDVDLGGMDGVELSLKVRERRGTLPVLYISGAVAKRPSDTFLSKPFTLPDLVGKVRALLAGVGK
jgi:DNA-binding response OmpR family regulator